MYKIVHIHTDYKFVSLTKIFEGDNFENSVVIINNTDPYEGPYKNKASIFSNKKESLNKIVQLCNNSDLVIMYGLEMYKAYITQNIKPDVKIAWRFFGAELYNLTKNKYLSDSSYKFVIKKSSVIFKHLYKLIKTLKLIYKKEYLGNYSIHKTMKQIDLFFVYSEEEYRELKDIHNNIPQFLIWPTQKVKMQSEDGCYSNKRNQIIIGNNMSPFNNHLDIIKIIRNIKTNQKIDFIIPFNYNNTHEAYSREVEKQVKDLDSCKLLTEFIPLEEYHNIITQSKALVHNSYRQMGLGNILNAIQNGVKVYLNEKSSVYHWLVQNGYIVFKIEHLKEDLLNGNIGLNLTQAQNNCYNYIKHTDNYSIELFQKRVMNKLR